jgi:hypothetical protein
MDRYAAIQGEALRHPKGSEARSAILGAASEVWKAANELEVAALQLEAA